MSASTLDPVATGCGRFNSLAGADAAAVLAAVRSSVAQVCKEQLAAEVNRLEPTLASGSASESTAALGAASLVLAEAAAVVGEAEAILRLRGLANDDATGWRSRRPYLEDHIRQSRRILAGLEHDATGWRSRRPYLEDHIRQSRRILAGLERDSPECRRLVGCVLLADMTLVSGLASNFCRTPTPPAYRASVVDDLASGIQAVQVSA